MWLRLELRLLDRLWLLLSGLLCISLVDFVFDLVKQTEWLAGFTAGLKAIQTRIETLLGLPLGLLNKLLLRLLSKLLLRLLSKLLLRLLRKLSLWLLSKLLPWCLCKLLLGLLSKLLPWLLSKLLLRLLSKG